MYLIRAEQRYGNGDHVFTVEEQSSAINALYDVARGEQERTARRGARGWASRSTSDRRYRLAASAVGAAGAAGCQADSVFSLRRTGCFSRVVSAF